MKKLLPILLAVFSIYISACKKDNKIGAGLLPGTDLSNAIFTDTFTVNAKTVSDTFLRTDKLAKNFLGVINDLKFGLQKAAIAVELDRPNILYGDSLKPYTIDSAYLLLKYYSVYGDTTVAQNFNVYELNSNVNPDLIYYSNNTSLSGSTLLGSVNNYKFRPSKSETYYREDTVGIRGVLKIPISSSFMQSILNVQDSIQRDTTLFRQNVFKGLYIENADLLGNAMAEIENNSIYSGIYVYLKDKNNNTKSIKLQTNIYTVVNSSILTKLRGVNQYQNTLSPTVSNVISSTAETDSILYFLGQSGTRIKINLPTVPNLGKQSINLATLEFTQIENNSNAGFSKPQSLFLLIRNSVGNLSILPTSEGLAIFDTTATDDYGNKITRYRINITKYIQSLVSGNESNTELYVTNYPPAGIDASFNILSITPKALASTTSDYYGYAPERVILAGPTHSNTKFKMKLKLYYTLLK